MEYLETISKINTPYLTNPPSFCYPGTTLPYEFGEISRILTPLQINNIGTHTYGITSSNSDVPVEGGFETPNKMEREYIWWIAQMLYKTLKGDIRDHIDGYFCGGGTEGNIEGMWIGREYLKSKSSDPINVIVTPLTHYSVLKGAYILNINDHTQYVKCNDRFEMDLDDLKNTIDRVILTSNNLLIVGTASTTMCGSIDPISGINDIILSYKKTHPLVNFYFHVDASFGGFTIPFVTNDILIGFENSEVQSITVDADKMGMLPYPSGIFLCRKDWQKLVKINVPYVGSHMDMTISGSRTAVSIACGWYYMKQYGVPWHRSMVQQCIAKRDELVEMLKNVEGVTILPYSPYVNMLPISVKIDPHTLNPLYNMRSDEVEYHGQKIPVYKLCIFPHTFEYFNQFVTDLEHAIEQSNKDQCM
jgi:tyrosine decarboxylase/aspartate 1-decarboxylase